MAWYFIYDLTDGSPQGTTNYRIDDSIYAAQNRGQIEYPDDMDVSNFKVDVTQTPPTLIPND